MVRPLSTRVPRIRISGGVLSISSAIKAVELAGKGQTPRGI
mgnify:CR=1 FL=1